MVTRTTLASSTRHLAPHLRPRALQSPGPSVAPAGPRYHRSPIRRHRDRPRLRASPRARKTQTPRRPHRRSLLHRHLSRQHLPVHPPPQRLRPRHRRQTPHPSLLPARARRRGPMVHWSPAPQTSRSPASNPKPLIDSRIRLCPCFSFCPPRKGSAVPALSKNCQAFHPKIIPNSLKLKQIKILKVRDCLTPLRYT